MTSDETQRFKALFRIYCQEEVRKGHCDEDSCELCPVNSAYDEIFYKYADDADEGECDEE